MSTRGSSTSAISAVTVWVVSLFDINFPFRLFVGINRGHERDVDPLAHRSSLAVVGVRRQDLRAPRLAGLVDVVERLDQGAHRRVGVSGWPYAHVRAPF